MAPIEEETVVGVDLGTTFCKAVALDTSQNQIGVGAAPTPWMQDGPLTYLEPAQLERQARRAITEALTGSGIGGVAALGVTSMGESGVLLDRHGVAVAPVIAWFDETMDVERKELEQLVGAETFAERTGVPLDLTRSAVKYAWLRKNVPDSRRGIRWLSLAEWLVHRLGAQAATEASLGARTGFLELRTGRPYEDVWTWADAPPGLLDQPHAAGTVLGRAASAAALDGALLVVAGHDHQAAAHGVGARTHRDVVVSCGTTMTVVRHRDALTRDEVRAAVGKHIMIGPDLRRTGFSLQAGFMGGHQLDELAQRMNLQRGTPAYVACDELAAEMLAGRAMHTETRVPSHGVDRSAIETWSDGMTRVWHKIKELIVATGDSDPDIRILVCGGWARSQAFRAAAEAAGLGHIEVCDIAEPGAQGAALLAQEALTKR